MSAQRVPGSMVPPAHTAPQPLRERTRGTAAPEAARRLRCTRYDQMAKAASAGLMAHPHVESAIVEISGDDADLVFHLNCTIKADSDPSDLMETVSKGVISNIERMLGTEFSSRRLHFNRSLYSAA
ncbi:hypothetical protein ACHABQ_09055 [Nesterenkonia aurantiaca]|uniref:hypothetical protein n=1 Tax=Nesterenkonia aurantiaca TaxID=1436010 RepID=UPI003EE7D5B5